MSVLIVLGIMFVPVLILALVACASSGGSSRPTLPKQDRDYTPDPRHKKRVIL